MTILKLIPDSSKQADAGASDDTAATPPNAGADIARLVELMHEALAITGCLGISDSVRPACSIAHFAQMLLKERRTRDFFFEDDLFGEPVWDMLLELFVAIETRGRISVSSLCLSSRVPATTALRYIAMLEKRSYIERIADPADKRRVHVILTDAVTESVRSYLRRVAVERSVLLSTPFAP